MTLIAIGLIGMTLSIVNDVLYGGLVALNRVARPAFWWVVQTYLAAALALVVLFTSRNVVAFAAAYSFALVIPVITNASNVSRFIRGGRALDLELWVTMVRRGAPLLVLAGLILIYGTIDIPVLEALTDNVTVANYVVAYRWVTIPVFVATAVITASASSLSSFAVDDSGEFAALANRSLRLVLAISIPMAMGVFLTAYDLISLLYRPELQDSALLIRILAIHIPLAAISTVLGAVLIASDRQGRYAIVALIAAVLNPPLAIFFIQLTERRADDGAIGASIVTVATELFMVYGAFRLRRPGVFDGATLRYGARCLAASVIMAIPISLLPDLELFVKVGLGIVVYVAAALALRIVTVDDLTSLPKKLRNARRYTPEPTPATDVSEPADSG
jgi:O-antigen/teichoic acid export membrane protein